MIIYDEPSNRMVDTENGDYMTSELRESEKREWNFTLRDERDRPLLCTVVTERHIDESGESGGARLISYVLTKARIPTGQPDSPTYLDEDHPQIDRLAAFLKARHHALGHKPPHSYFEFVDERREVSKSKQSGAESLPSHSYQSATATQPLTKPHDQTLKVSPDRERHVDGASVFVGLLMTMALHLLQFLIVPLTLIHEKFMLLAFFIGFTQILYILPAIRYCHDHYEDGVKIGLIIGASLTFLLGLPFMLLGYAYSIGATCAT